MTLPAELDRGNAESARSRPLDRDSRVRPGSIKFVPGETDPTGMPAATQLERILLVPFASIDGEQLAGRDILRTRSLLVLIDAYRTRPERSAAEIAWVRERLESGTRLILIWPNRSADQAIQLAASDEVEQFLDLTGDYRRLVSPTGKRVAILIDPEIGIMRRVTEGDEIFSMAGIDGPVDRGNDHMIDLGDVYR